MKRKPTGAHPVDRLRSLTVKRKSRPGLTADGNCLYLRVDPSGARRWVLRVVIDGKRRNLGLGSARLVSLEEARELARSYRKIARAGGDPAAERDAARRRAEPAPSFEVMARHLFESKKAEFRSEKHGKQWIATLTAYAFPKIGELPVNEVDTDAVLSVLRPIWTEKPETASRTRQRIEAVLNYATASGKRIGDNPARWRGHLDHLLPKLSKIKAVKHFAALDWRGLPEFLSALDKREGIAAKALAFTILTAARSGEARGMTWGEVDAEDGVWTVPAARMKAGKEHRVPLTPAALALLGKPGKPAALVFPSPVRGGVLSDMTLSAVLKRMGKGELTVHGFRSSFRDWAGETTHHPREVIEHALAHQLKDKAEASYARGDLFQKRRALMQDWSNYATGGAGKVVAIRRRKA